MGLKPYDRKISQIFNNILYDVDFYQRDYKWSDDLDYKPVTSLLKDIFYRFDLEKYNPNQDITPEYIDQLEWYFLNSFLTNNVKGKKYIVDGQQRLTTLCLISIGLFHLANKFGLQSHIQDSLKNSIVGNTEFGKTYWMGFKDRKLALDDLMSNGINCKRVPTSISETNIYANYKVINSQLEEKFTTPHRLQMFISYFRHRIFLIETEVEKDKDVAMVFEVINDRGVPLKPYEILKGKVLSQIGILDRGGFIDIWESNIGKLEKLGEQKIDEFFGIYFRSKFSDSAEQYQKLDPIRYHKTIFTNEFEQKVGLKNNEANCRYFVEQVFPYFSNLYIELVSFCNKYDENHESIYFNSLNDMNGQFVLTLAAIELNDSDAKDKCVAVPKSFERFFSLLNLTGSYRSNEFNNQVINLVSQIRGKDVSICKDTFNNRLLELVKKSYDLNELDHYFKYDFFKNVGYSTLGKLFLRYFFARVDHFISDKSDLPEFGNYYQLVVQSRGNDTYHIEHIIANNPKNITLFSDEEEFTNQRNRLGGLLLLKGKDNQSSGDEIYDDKLKTYNVVGTYFAKSLLTDMYHKKVEFNKFVTLSKLNFKAYSKYGKDEIEERQQLLFEISKMIWM